MLNDNLNGLVEEFRSDIIHTFIKEHLETGVLDFTPFPYMKRFHSFNVTRGGKYFIDSTFTETELFDLLKENIFPHLSSGFEDLCYTKQKEEIVYLSQEVCQRPSFEMKEWFYRINRGYKDFCIKKLM